MPITEEQRQARKNHLGSSDIPAIMGYSRFANAYDVWLEKTGRVGPSETTKDYQTAGNMFEEGVLKWWQQEKNPGPLLFNQERTVSGIDAPIVVHPDAIVEADGEPVEGKTEGLYGPIILPWGEEGTDEVPEYTLIQAHCHMMATEKDLCHIPTFLGGRGFGYFFARRDPDIVKLIREQAVRFWTEHVLADKAPPESVPSLATIKRIRRIEGARVDLADELVQHWNQAKVVAKTAKSDVEHAKAAILAALDGAELGLCSHGEVTNFEQHRKECIQKASDFRVLRIRKKK